MWVPDGVILTAGTGDERLAGFYSPAPTDTDVFGAVTVTEPPQPVCEL